MPKYIDADELIGAVDGNRFVTDSVKSYVRCTVRNIPAANVEPVRHGRWIEKKKNMTEGAAYMIPLIIKYFVCSLCGREEDIAEPYCNCGAKMDGEADDGE